MNRLKPSYRILWLFLVVPALVSVTFILIADICAAASKQMEALDRGLIASEVDDGVFISWRSLGTESMSTGYNLYRDAVKVNDSPITDATNYVDSSGSYGSAYSIAAVVNGTEQQASEAVGVWNDSHLDIPLQIPSGGTTPDGVSYTYSANDCSVGDLDDDGEYEIIVKWDPSNSKDNSKSGYTGNVYLDAYKLDGTLLWRIDLGINIRAGAHYTQFIVYDLDGDGRSEVACKIADGMVDGTGTVFGDADADYRNSSGYVLSGPEYLGIFSGANGRLLEYVTYQPERGTVSDWGDSYGNRVDRFLAGVAYLDGAEPSLIMCRGYYTRSVIVAWDYRDGDVTRRWTFDSDDNTAYAGQGNHQLSIADVDDDGKDEIIYGAATIDHDGSGLYSSGLGHGDALHVGDLNPNRSGLEIWSPFESDSVGAALRDAESGKIIFKYNDSDDVGRACSADITTDYPGEEMWASSGCPLYSATGQNIGSAPSQKNFAIWWDGDELRELLDGTKITKYGGGTLLSAGNHKSNNGTKATPCLSADIFGDWREEVIFRTSDSNYLTIFTTTYPTDRKLFTLMHDPMYRTAIAWQNVAYNQPPHPSFFIGDGMPTPSNPDIYLVGGGGADSGSDDGDSNSDDDTKDDTDNDTDDDTDNDTGDLGTNLAVGAGSDGSSKVSGTSYKYIRDGDLSTYWQPKTGSGERVSIKWSSTTTFNTIVIRERSDVVTSWRLVDNNTGKLLSSGSSIGSELTVYIEDVSTKKVNLMIDDAGSAPQIAEMEIYNSDF